MNDVKLIIDGRTFDLPITGLNEKSSFTITQDGRSYDFNCENGYVKSVEGYETKITKLETEVEVLTKREQFAIAAMQSVISNGDYYRGFIIDSVAYADELLKELEK